MNKYSDIFSIKNHSDFEKICLETFLYQANCCKPYGKWLKLLDININDIDKLEKIPFIPIELFKTEKIYCSDIWEKSSEKTVFGSSGTTGASQSLHYVADVNLYEQSFINSFELFYGNPQNYVILGLLPSYLERQEPESSLIYMVRKLITKTADTCSGFYLDHNTELLKTIIDSSKKPTVLIGVTYALLDFAEHYVSQDKSMNFPNLIVMETGGMKGRRKELSRAKLHEILCKGFGKQNIHSEYGMTELLSQAYSKELGKFLCPPWMKILIRDIHNPFKLLPANTSGGINVIDLANRNSCSFIATQDLGKINTDGSFEILGRLNISDIRGCNLLVQA